MSRARVTDLVESTAFRAFIFAVIFLNAITIGMQASSTYGSMVVLEVFDNVCLLIYIVEAALKLYAYRLDYFRNGWNVFDFAIIVLSLMALGFMSVPVQFARVIRLVRVTRTLKAISLFGQMRIIVEAIGKSISGVLWSTLLLVIVIYIFDVIGVSSFGQDFPEEFGNLGNGAITLFEIALTGWPDIAHEVSETFTWAYAYFVAYVICSAFVVLNVIVGIIVEAIQDSAQADRDETARGQSPVRQTGHVLILGFNAATIAILGELIEANMNQRERQYVVVLDDCEKASMERAITDALGPSYQHGSTWILCRCGSVYDVEALRRCGIVESKAVIVNADSDFATVKAIMACSHVLNGEGVQSESFAVAAIHNGENEEAAMIAGCEGEDNDRLELLPMQKVIARILVNTSRQPGLSGVYVELFNFDGNELYIVERDACFPALWGKTVAEVNLRLKSAIAVGVEREGKCIVAAPESVIFSAGDSLIVVEEDDDPLEVLPTSAPVEAIVPGAGSSAEPVSVVILGAFGILRDVLGEYASYLPSGSRIVVADPQAERLVPYARIAEQALAIQGIDLVVDSGDIYDKKQLFSLLSSVVPASVLVLADDEADDAEADDQRVMNLVLYLRDYRNKTNRRFGVTAQMSLDENRALIDATGDDDYIVGRHFTALLMAQISQKREMCGLFDDLLSSEGFEAYVNRASAYVPLGVELDLFTVGAAVAKRGETFVGLRCAVDGRYQEPELNPGKFEADGKTLKRYVFTEADYFVVFAERELAAAED